MDITTASPPSPGTAAPGNLYIDTASRQMWLGVDAAVDPAQALLISDIVQLEADISQAVVTANAYTDTRISTRAPTVHTHTASQITDFTGAVQTVVTAMPSVAWVKGMIMMWSGSLAEIGVGGLAGWTLCDGSNGSPDLRDRFIVGAGNKVPGAKNNSTGIVTQTGGQHTHTINGTVITEAQMPAHYHTLSVFGSTVSNTSTESAAHAHNLPTNYMGPWNGANNDCGAGSSGSFRGPATGTQSTNHFHNVTVNLTSTGNSGYTGGSQAHDHVAAQGGTHSHTIPLTDLREGIPYFALAFIMKL